MGKVTGLAANGRPIFGGGSCDKPAIARMVADPAKGTNMYFDDLVFAK